nr:CPCC family cysteine-rich protein [Paenibacillus sinopodophylli]
MNNITRENAFKIIESVRNIIGKEIDLSEYLEEETSIINKEQNEVEVDFQGVSNGYLAEIVHAISGYQVEVIGEVEELYSCPCCGFKTLTELYGAFEGAGYDICPYCKWEDDGTSDINSYRSINKGSIVDYRNELRINSNKYYTNKWLDGKG